jgi:putative acetyltransferase
MDDVSIVIREERPDDIAAIRDVNARAFGQDQESDLVDALRSNGAALLSLVATLNGQVVGHVMYSPVSVGDDVTGAGLGPVAVLPEHQCQGIGSQLIEAGNQKLKDRGCPFIVVVGHADYYPRFGFRSASLHGYLVRMGCSRRCVHAVGIGRGTNAGDFRIGQVSARILERLLNFRSSLSA